jgi:hypothetical protein
MEYIQRRWRQDPRALFAIRNVGCVATARLSAECSAVQSVQAAASDSRYR